MTPLAWTATHILVPRERLPGLPAAAPNPSVAAAVVDQWRTAAEIERHSGMTRATVLRATRALAEMGRIEISGGNVPRYRRVGT